MQAPDRGQWVAGIRVLDRHGCPAGRAAGDDFIDLNNLNSLSYGNRVIDVPCRVGFRCRVTSRVSALCAPSSPRWLWALSPHH